MRRAAGRAPGVARAAACGAAVGLALAARALWEPPGLPLLAALAVTVAAVLAHAAASALLALPLARWTMASAGDAEVAARRSWAAASAIALALLLATLRLRYLVGLGQMALWPLLPSLFVESAAAGVVLYWLLGRLPVRRLASAWRVVAAGAFAVALVALARPAFDAELTAAPPPGSRPNFLFVTVDTLRADRLGCYGNPDGLTPNLDRLAAEAVRFARAIAPATLTGPSHLTMLTGLYPARHGALRNGQPLRDDVETVAEPLARAGYRTAGFVSAWPLTQASSGLAARFQRYDENLSDLSWRPLAAERVPLLWLADRAGMFATHWRSNVGRGGRFLGELHQRPGDRAVDLALDWIARDRERPFFAFVHLYEPHAPCAPPAAIARQVDPNYSGTLDRHEHVSDPWTARALYADPAVVRRIRKLYDAEVRVADALVGRLLAGLERLGRDGDTVVVVTADHGEGLGEHGEYFDHAEYFYETTLHVPLLVRTPRGDRPGAVDEELARLADIAPTVLSFAGIAPRDGLDGSSLVARLAGRAAEPPPFAHGSSSNAGPHARNRHFARTRRHKLIWTTDARLAHLARPEAEEFYDLESDPGELRPLATAEAGADVLEALRHEMLAWLTLDRGAAEAAIDPETARRLRALGYL